MRMLAVFWALVAVVVLLVATDGRAAIPNSDGIGKVDKWSIAWAKKWNNAHKKPYQIVGIKCEHHAGSTYGCYGLLALSSGKSVTPCKVSWVLSPRGKILLQTKPNCPKAAGGPVS